MSFQTQEFGLSGIVHIRTSARSSSSVAEANANTYIDNSISSTSFKHKRFTTDLLLYGSNSFTQITFRCPDSYSNWES